MHDTSGHGAAAYQESFPRLADRVVAADPEWWRGAVIYHIYPLSFCDSNGDGIGDLPGIIGKLDYIASLGVDAIWLSPFFVSPMKDFGYDVADHRAVDPSFGTLADFDALVARAHRLGLKVLIDQVWSHTSDQHAWFRASRAARGGPKADWYVWEDARADGTPPNNWLSVFGGAAWTWDPRRRQYYLHHFLASQPQLNLRNPETLDAVLASGAFWLDRGVDGFRLDAIDFMSHDAELRDNPPAPPPGGVIPMKPFALQQHRYDMLQPEIDAILERVRALMDRYPGTATLGEVSSQDGAISRIAAYSGRPDRLHMAYTLRVLRDPLDAERLRGAIEAFASAPGDGWMCWAFSNHDAERAVSRWNPRGEGSDPDLARLLLALLVSLRGSACIYQGEELALPEADLDVAALRDPFGLAYYPEFRGRDGSRTPMPWTAARPHAGFTAGEQPWLPVPDAHYALAVDCQEADARSPLNALRRLLRWRKQHPALLRGTAAPCALPAPLFGCERRLGAERILIVCNLSEETARLPFAGFPGLQPLEGHGFAWGIAHDAAILPRWGVFFGRIEDPA